MRQKRILSAHPSRIVITRIAQITDLHLLPPGELLMDLDVNERLQRVLDHAAAREPDAYFITGDCCAMEPLQDVFYRLRPRLDALGKPYYITPGNHDDRRMLRNAFYLDGHGDEPIKGLVRVNDRNFLFLDTCPARVDEEQVNWLAAALAEYPEADLVMHHPPVPLGVNFMDTKYPLQDTDALLDVLLGTDQPRRVFCGHFHSGRTVQHGPLEVHLCPPTSFFIDPEPEDFHQEFLPPAYLWLEWAEDGSFRAAPTFVASSPGKQRA